MSVSSSVPETVLIVPPMIFSAIWGAITGDTVIPALMGGFFAAYFQARKNSRKLIFVDAVVIVAMSFVVGMIAGPWVAAQLPDGDGVVGVGTLIASFLGTAFLQKLHEMDWDISKVLSAMASAFKDRPKG